MGTDRNYEPKFDLPRPAEGDEQALPPLMHPEEAYEKKPENPNLPLVNQPQTSTPPPNMSANPLLTQAKPTAKPSTIAPPSVPVGGNSPTSPTDNTTPVTSVPDVAEDTDLIEKEWVDRAKEIVDKTRNNPHQQNKEMTKFKADYMKKRYNKDIKLEE